MVRKFGIVQNNTQWPMEKSSILSIFFGSLSSIETTQNKEWVFVNHGTTTRENKKTKQSKALRKNWERE